MKVARTDDAGLFIADVADKLQFGGKRLHSNDDLVLAKLPQGNCAVRARNFSNGSRSPYTACTTCIL
eukprot:3997750-Amphidinium_carterae.2